MRHEYRKLNCYDKQMLNKLKLQSIWSIVWLFFYYGLLSINNSNYFSPMPLVMIYEKNPITQHPLIMVAQAQFELCMSYGHVMV